MRRRVATEWGRTTDEYKYSWRPFQRRQSSQDAASFGALLVSSFILFLRYFHYCYTWLTIKAVRLSNGLVVCLRNYLLRYPKNLSVSGAYWAKFC